MAGVKISALGAATLPLTGDELVPLVQNGVTVQTPSSGFAGYGRLLRMFKPILTAIPLGTSITQSNNNNSSALPRLGGGSVTVNGLYQAGIQVVENAGVAGNTVYQCSARLPGVLAQNPDMVLLECMTNSITAGMSQSALVAALNELEGMVIDCLAANILPMLVVLPAKNGAVTEVSWCRYFMYRMANYYGIALADLFNVTINPATGDYVSAYSSDGVHPSGAGLVVCANEITSAIQNMRSHNGYIYYSAYDATTAGTAQNLLRNGCFSRSASPPVPDGWATSAVGATRSLVAATPTYAERYKIGNTFTYNKTISGFVQALGSDGTNSFAVGDVLDFAARVRFSGLSGGGTPALNYLEFDFVGNADSFIPMYQTEANGDYLLSSQMTVPTGSTHIYPSFYLGDICLMEVNSVTLTNRTANDAVWQPGQQ